MTKLRFAESEACRRADHKRGSDALKPRVPAAQPADGEAHDRQQLHRLEHCPRRIVEVAVRHLSEPRSSGEAQADDQVQGERSLARGHRADAMSVLEGMADMAEDSKEDQLNERDEPVEGEVWQHLLEDPLLDHARQLHEDNCTAREQEKAILDAAPSRISGDTSATYRRP
eukprot:CAMPEP_0174758836 /NCGR_PEP_ID=MMETSP1094-20130205/107966_1 /TAXON_ID=156173 /ORGANISM="Chrysochromulina brevifilum, Strain UTEX LB 985" /LENGTH=170 /DNA_ID=CAMNT_0015964767 /DNA_START=1703 /DNA_END=2213 /DNA_ORIENTATION=+